ncbi:hypothetical protein [Rhodocista pekingensis]|uniref:Uncharacterized protein n=1 Tax=Rhodocista pekingensis TaxID=201185 RepID=A0ABW2KZ91_9PROT
MATEMPTDLRPSSTVPGTAARGPAVRGPMVPVPRWMLRLTLGLCLLFALMLSGHALAGLGGAPAWLTPFLWLGAAGFSVWSFVLIALHLGQERTLARGTRLLLTGLAALVMGVTASLAVTALMTGLGAGG